MRPLLLLPEMLLFGAGLVVLLGGSFLPRERQWVGRVIAAMALVASITVSAIALAKSPSVAFDGAYTVDIGTGVARVVAAFGTLLILVLAGDEVAGSPRESETYSLLLFSTTGTIVLAGAQDLIVLCSGFLLASIPLYGLVGMARGPRAAEAAMKTYLMGALFGIVLLLGVTILYAVSASSRYADLAHRLGPVAPAAVAAGLLAVLAGLLFEGGAVPAHFWVPDAAQAAGSTAAAFLTTVPKIGALVAVYRLLTVMPDTVAWPLLVAILATLSMTLGNLAAFGQRDPRRLLGWSTVSQVGYLLVPVAVAGRSPLALPSLLFYLAGYTVTNIAAFAVAGALPGRRDLREYAGLSRQAPWLAAALAVSLLGLVGTPPTGVFVGKLAAATAAWDGGMAWLALATLVNSLTSLTYYLSWIAPVFSMVCKSNSGEAQVWPLPWSKSAAVGAAALSLAVGIGGGLVWQVVAGG